MTFDEVFDEVDSDDDGALLLEEFITCVGMIKKFVLEVMELEKSFTRVRTAGGRTMQGDDASSNPGQSADDKTKEGRTVDDDVEHTVYALDLVAALGVSEQEAEEMIFIADLQDDSSIDFTEFRQLVVNWD